MTDKRKEALEALDKLKGGESISGDELQSIYAAISQSPEVMRKAKQALLAAQAMWEYTDTVPNNMAINAIEEALALLEG